MKHTLSKFIAVVAIIASTLLSSAPVLAGGGGSYYWTDLSNLIVERQNRPIWAMAYASPYWYLTDGQDLWSGGHVWRTEGSAMADITYDVRNAGLSRVDDIVSDGQTVLFLKGITAKNNSFEILKYNGTFSNVSYTLRSQLSSDEGIISLNGKNGMWAFVTTKGRVSLWNTGNNTVTSILNNTVNYPDYLNYSVYGTSPSAETGFYAFAVPVSNGWFIGQRQGNYSDLGNMRLWLRDLNGNLTDVTSKFSTFDDTEFIASNGNSAIFLARRFTRNSTSRVLYSYDGVNKTDLSTQYYNADSSFTWFRAIAAYDGSAWLITERGDNLTNRSTLRIEGTGIYKLALMKDYFIDMASNGNGTILLGGVEAEAGVEGPNLPLIAKLTKASTTNPGGTTNINTFGGGGTYTSTNGPTISTDGNPSTYQIKTGETFAYRATAWDANGVNRVSLYVDGSLAKTCYSDTCEYSNVYYSNSVSTRSIPVYAIAMDNQGYTTQTSQETLTVNQGTTTDNQQNSQQDSASGTYHWTYLNPDQTYLKRGSSMTYNVGANDTDGINRIEVVVNGSVRKTCTLNNWTGNQTCTHTLYGNDYLLNSQIAVNAKIVDGAGKETWTALKYINVTDTDYSNDSSGDVSAWGWFDPSGSTLQRGNSTVFKVQANATQGLQKVEIYADGSLKRTCDYSRAYGTQSCNLTVYGNDYSIAQHGFNAKATDYYGKTSWSDTKNLTIQDNGGSSNSNSVYVWSWFDPSSTTLQRGTSMVFRTRAQTSNGLQRVEVYVNGTVKRTCDFSRSYGEQSCDLTIYGNDYSTNSQLALNAKATDYYGYTSWSNLNYLTITDSNNTGDASTNGSVGLQANPNKLTFSNGEYVTFNGGAFDPDGLQRIEILKNGSVIKTCNYDNSTAWQTCAYGTNVYTNGSNSLTFTVAVKAYDRYGHVRGVNPITYTVNGQGSNSGSDTGTSPSTWSWSEPNENLNIQTSGSATYHIGAWDQDGLKRIEMWVNGMVAHTCYFGSSLAYGNQECTFTVKGSNYKAGDAIYVNAKAVDAYDHEGWSPSRTYTVVNQDSQMTTSNIGKLTAWSSADSGYGIMDAITFWTKGSDNDGISKIEIIVNAQTIKTCYNTDSCSIVGGPYSGRSYITYGAKLTDKLNNATYSGYKTIYKK
ncbi:MAG: hypothetical protein RDU25_01310 [Patescibacteria group bacterium]|nr:hypothetical protein [Patescibacteria group bacterium]